MEMNATNPMDFSFPCLICVLSLNIRRAENWEKKLACCGNELQSKTRARGKGRLTLRSLKKRPLVTGRRSEAYHLYPRQRDAGLLLDLCRLTYWLAPACTLISIIFFFRIIYFIQFNTFYAAAYNMNSNAIMIRFLIHHVQVSRDAERAVG